MRFAFLKWVIFLSTVCLCSTASYADLDKKQNQIFQTECVKTWMERAGQASNAVDFKNFGEKYCECGATKPLDTKADIENTAKICMSETLLRETMDSLEDEEGLANLTRDKIQTSCQDKWNLVYPDMNDNKKSSTQNYCQCASPKLLDLNMTRDQVTDKEWYEKINAIADTCANNVEADENTVNLDSKIHSNKSDKTE